MHRCAYLMIRTSVRSFAAWRPVVSRNKKEGIVSSSSPLVQINGLGSQQAAS